MSMAEFFACAEGWNRVHGAPEKPEPPSDSNVQKMLDKIEKKRK